MVEVAESDGRQFAAAKGLTLHPDIAAAGNSFVAAMESASNALERSPCCQRLIRQS